MRTLLTLITVFSIPVMLVNFLGGIIGAVWLIYLGIWKPIGVSIVLLFFGAFALSFLLVPSLIFAIPAAKAVERGNTKLAVFAGIFSLLYTTVLIVGWAFAIMKGYAGMGPESAQWPLMLLSYGAATGPWAYMASKDQQSQDGGNQYSIFHVFFLSVAYIIAIGARLLASATFETCLWILIATIAFGLIFQMIMVTEENKIRRTFGL